MSKEQVNTSDLKCCPHCGHDEFFNKQTLTGKTEYYGRYDGEQVENGHVYDDIEAKYSKYNYCSMRRKRVGLSGLD